MRRTWMLVLLVFSGFAGLSYELLWVRLLANSFGSTTLSFSTVLAVFFGGLAFGSRWAGRRVSQSTRPVTTYAALEALTGLAALALLPAMQQLGALFGLLDPGPGVAGVVVRAVTASLLLLPPTFLMGATLPYVCLASISNDDASGRGTALIYGFNTVGACLGAYAVTFWMLPHLGVTVSTLLVALVNFTVAGAAWLLARKTGGDGPASAAAEEAVRDETQPLERRLVVLATFVGGFVATGAQVVWARYFSIALRGTAYGVGAVLVSVLVGISLGSLLAARLARRRERVAASAAGVQLLFLMGLTVFASASPLFFYALGTATQGFKGTELHHVHLVLVWLLLSVPTLASGASLPLLVAVLATSARGAGPSLAKVYVANTVGCILGSVLIGFWALPALGSSTTLYVLVVAATLVLALFAVGLLRQQRLTMFALVAAGLALAAYFPGLSVSLTRSAEGVTSDYYTFLANQAQRSRNLTYFHEGDVATVTLFGSFERGGGLSLNGLGQGGRSVVAPEVVWESALVGAMPWLHAPSADRGLVVGLGAGGTIRSLLDLGVRQLEVVELERGVLEAVELLWGERNPVRDPRVTVVVDDARQYLRVQGRRAPKSYDFITSMPAHPWVASALFTVEFFEIVTQNLKPNGVFSMWFGAFGMSDEAVEAVFGAFTRVFPHFVVYWVQEAGAFYAVGSPTEFVLDESRFRELEASPVMAGRPLRQRSAWSLLSRVVAASSPRAPQTPLQRANTDDNALLEFSLLEPGKSNHDLSYFAFRTLPLERLRAPAREAAVVELTEWLAGTPEGRLPAPRKPNVEGLRRFVEGFPPDASGDAYDYARLRALLAQGKLEEAREVQRALQAEPLAGRAARFMAAAEPSREKRREALMALQGQPEVRALLEREGVVVGAAPLDPSDDPIRWLYVPAWPTTFDEAERAAFGRGLLERLGAYASAVLYERCQQLAVDPYRDVALQCAVAKTAAARNEASALLAAAQDARERREFKEAVALLWRAHQREPLPHGGLTLLAQAALQVGDEASVQRVRQIWLLRGVEPQTIESQLENARRANEREAREAMNEG